MGKLSYINFDHSVYDPDNYGWRLNLYSVVLEDMSAHHFDLFRYITNKEPVSVYAEGWHPDWSQYPGKVCHNVLITMTDDIHINYFATWTARGKKNTYDGIMKIVGEGGTLDLVDPETLLFYPSADPEPCEENSEPHRIPIEPIEYTEREGVIREFIQALENKTNQSCQVDDNLGTLAIICGALESCRTEQRVDIKKMLSKI